MQTAAEDGEMRVRCRKHEPVPLPNGNLIDQLAGKVVCANCGLRGQYSNGRRKFGRPPRVIWWHWYHERQAATLKQGEGE